MAAQYRHSALGDGRHHLELRQAQLSALSVALGGSVGTEDVGDLQGGSPLHRNLGGPPSLQQLSNGSFV